jgi:hypothetical protein
MVEHVGHVGAAEVGCGEYLGAASTHLMCYVRSKKAEGVSLHASIVLHQAKATTAQRAIDEADLLPRQRRHMGYIALWYKPEQARYQTQPVATRSSLRLSSLQQLSLQQLSEHTAPQPLLFLLVHEEAVLCVVDPLPLAVELLFLAR